MNSSQKTIIFNSILVFIAGASYGFIVPVIKTAGSVGIYMPTFVPLQYLIALIACVIFVSARCISGRLKLLPIKKLLPLTILGICTGGTSLCYYGAVALLPSSAALTLLFQYVWVCVLLECIQQRRLPSKSSVISVAIVLVGTIFATGLFDGTVSDLNPFGVLCGIGSAVFYALFLYLSGIVGAKENVALRAMMLAFGGLVTSSIVTPQAFSLAIADATVLQYSLALSFLGILFPTTVINYASPKISAGMVSIMASSELPVGILAAWWLVSDVPSPTVLFGAFLVLAGIVCKQILSMKQNI